MDHTQHQRLTEAELTDAVLTGATVYGPGDETVGSVAHVHGSGGAAQVVVEVGGFLGIGAKSVAVQAANLEFMRDENGTVHALSSWTKDQLTEMPEHRD